MWIVSANKAAKAIWNERLERKGKKVFLTSLLVNPAFPLFFLSKLREKKGLYFCQHLAENLLGRKKKQMVSFQDIFY